MAEHSRADSFTFDAEEIRVLVACIGAYSRRQIEQAGLDVDAFERVYSAATQAAYAATFDAAIKSPEAPIALNPPRPSVSVKGQEAGSDA